MTESIIQCATKISNALGAGFLEKVYENTLAIELRKADLEVEQQKKINVKYESDVVGGYIADFVVNKSVLLEIKATKSIDKVHQAQLLNYLKATGLRVGLVLNFGASRLGTKRVVL
ncbi:MAG: GxxExxY protein [Nitrospinaceae bacterium]|nr:GxxExxY protein [Nitrospinaceae bacterium]